MHNLEAEDSTSETCNINTRYKYSTDGPNHSSGLDPLKYLFKDIEFYTEYTQCGLYGSLL